MYGVVVEQGLGRASERLSASTLVHVPGLKGRPPFKVYHPRGGTDEVRAPLTPRDVVPVGPDQLGWQGVQSGVLLQHVVAILTSVGSRTKSAKIAFLQA